MGEYVFIVQICTTSPRMYTIHSDVLLVSKVTEFVIRSGPLSDCLRAQEQETMIC